MAWGRIGNLGRVDDNGRVLPDEHEARFGKAGKRLCADIDGWSLHAAMCDLGQGGATPDTVGR